MPSNVVDINSPTANIYGCEPCPRCGSIYRCIFVKAPSEIVCDECDYTEEKAEKAVE